MFRPNVPCTIARMSGFTGAGKRNYAAPVKSACAIVYLRDSSDQTSVRTDSSASKATARDNNIQARLLFPASVTLGHGDKVTFANFTMTVQLIHPRFGVDGHLDHYQVDLDVWAG